VFLIQAFRYGSGSADPVHWITDPDPGHQLSSNTPPHKKFFLKFFAFYLPLLRTFKSVFKFIKTSQNCMLMAGSGSVQILTDPDRSIAQKLDPKHCFLQYLQYLIQLLINRTGLLKSASSPPSLLFLRLYLIIFHPFPYAF
jgi:hypothetical protein